MFERSNSSLNPKQSAERRKQNHWEWLIFCCSTTQYHTHSTRKRISIELTNVYIHTQTVWKLCGIETQGLLRYYIHWCELFIYFFLVLFCVDIVIAPCMCVYTIQMCVEPNMNQFVRMCFIISVCDKVGG